RFGSSGTDLAGLAIQKQPSKSLFQPISFLVNLTRLLFRIRGGPPVNESATLVQVIADLDNLNHGTEQDFLIIGAKLAEFIATVDLISSGLAALAHVICGEHGPRASEALTASFAAPRKWRNVPKKTIIYWAKYTTRQVGYRTLFPDFTGQSPPFIHLEC